MHAMSRILQISDKHIKKAEHNLKENKTQIEKKEQSSHIPSNYSLSKSVKWKHFLFI